MLNGTVAVVILACWMLCLGVSLYSMYMLNQPTNKSILLSNTYISAFGISVLIGIALTINLVAAMTTLFGLSQGQATFIGAVVLLAVIASIIALSLKCFKAMREMSGHYTKGFY